MRYSGDDDWHKYEAEWEDENDGEDDAGTEDLGLPAFFSDPLVAEARQWLADTRDEAAGMARDEVEQPIPWPWPVPGRDELYFD